jgi:hypothetical protein
VYLQAFPDVQDAVDRGDLATGWEHYLHAGRSEGRLDKPEYRRLATAGVSTPHNQPAPPVSVDALLMTPAGAILLAGWADDREVALIGLTVLAADQPISAWTRFPRLRRSDVGRAIDGPPNHPYGFWAFAGPHARRPLPVAAVPMAIEFRFANGRSARVERPAQVVAEADLRDALKGRLASLGHPDHESGMGPVSLDRRIGRSALAFIRGLPQPPARTGITERFGPRNPSPRLSIIVPLTGGPQGLFLHGSILARCEGIETCEFIYWIARQDQADPILREAMISQQIYGLPQTVLCHPDLTDPSAAANAAAEIARSDRLVFMHADVLPQRPDWLQHHADIVSSPDRMQSRLFGALLLFDNGSVRHAGYGFAMNSRVDVTATAISRCDSLRIDSLAKGATAHSPRSSRSRPVPAVSSAFLSIDRSWFRHLGGFSRSYHTGPFEDIDLCLRSLQEDQPAWFHPIPMWHLAPAEPGDVGAAEAETVLDQWLFHHHWSSLIVPQLLGPSPPHPLLAADLPPGSPAPSFARW